MTFFEFRRAVRLGAFLFTGSVWVGAMLWRLLLLDWRGALVCACAAACYLMVFFGMRAIELAFVRRGIR